MCSGKCGPGSRRWQPQVNVNLNNIASLEGAHLRYSAICHSPTDLFFVVKPRRNRDFVNICSSEIALALRPGLHCRSVSMMSAAQEGLWKLSNGANEADAVREWT